jgi:hypothetical protein
MQAARKLHSLPVKLSAGALLVALADLFFYDHPLGWATGLYGMALLCVITALHGGLLRGWLSQLVAFMLCALSAALVAAPGLLPLLLFALGIVALLVLHKRRAPEDATVWLKDFLKFLWKALQQWENDRSIVKDLRRRNIIAPLRVVATAVLAVTPGILTIAFALLFAQANPVIGKIVAEIDWDFLADLLSPWRCLFWIGTGMMVWAVLRPRFRPAKPAAPRALPNLDRWFNPASVTMSLAVFNLLFGLQNGLDIAFLWSGRPLPEGLSYAEYAHAGAYPLIVTALLAAGYILITFGDAKYQTRATKALVHLWIAQNIFLVVSSIDRDLNYIAIYSLTYLRLSALIWMGLVASGLALIVVKIQLSRSNMWLINMNALALVAVLYACCFVNFDGIIADYNVRHAREVTGSGELLDMAYTHALGPEALPALRWFQLHARFNPDRAAEAGRVADTIEADLAKSLDSDWHAWTWRNQSRLDEIMSKLPPPPRPLDHTGWQPKE